MLEEIYYVEVVFLEKVFFKRVKMIKLKILNEPGSLWVSKIYNYQLTFILLKLNRIRLYCSLINHYLIFYISIF